MALISALVPGRLRRDFAMRDDEVSFSPSDLSGLQLWLPPSNLGSDPVSSWSDSSGQGNDASQGTAGERPSYAETGLNGGPSASFDGENDSLVVADADGLDLDTAIEIVMVVNPSDVKGPPQALLSKSNYVLTEYDDEILWTVIGALGSWSKSGDVGTSPRGLAVYDGQLYVVCSSTDDVYVFDGTSWSKSGDVGTSPRGLAVYDGQLYVSCFNSDDVYVFDGTSWSKSGDVGDRPLGLAVYDGQLYVSCSGTDDVYVFDGTSWSKSGDVGTSPLGLAVYDGQLYVSCFNSDDVYVIGSGAEVRIDRGSGPIIVQAYYNGSEIGIHIGDGAFTTTAHSLSVSANARELRIGDGDGSTQAGYLGGEDPHVSGDVSEVVIFNAALTSAERDDLYAYLESNNNF